MTLIWETRNSHGVQREPVLAALILLAGALLFSTGVGAWWIGHAAGASQEAARSDLLRATLDYCGEVVDGAVPIVREHDAEILAKLRLLGPEKDLAPLVDGG